MDVEFFNPDTWNCVTHEDFLGYLDKRKSFNDLEMLSSPAEIDFPVWCYLTSIPLDKAGERIENLYNLGFPQAPVVICEDKLTYCQKARIDWLVDDKPTTVEQFKAADQNIIQFMTYYAKWEPVKDIPSIKSLLDVNNIIHG